MAIKGQLRDKKMAITKFTIPKLNNSEPSKWLIRYTIHIDGVAEYRKEVGATYPQLGDTLNSKNMRSIGDKKRTAFAEDIIDLLVAELEDGVDPENSKEGYLYISMKVSPLFRGKVATKLATEHS